MIADKTASVLYARRDGSSVPLAPETDAAQVAMADENGAASTVDEEIVRLRDSVRAALSNGVLFRGSLTAQTALPSVAYKAGWQYVVEESGTYAGVACEPGDMVICVRDYAAASAGNDDWNVIQANLVGAVTGPSRAGDRHVAVFQGVSGRVVADSGFTLGASVPADAVFTDTTYPPADASSAGLMSAADKAKLDAVEPRADVTDAANVAAAGAFMTDSMTSDDVRQGSSHLFLTAARQSKLDAVESGAQKNQNAFARVAAGGVTLNAASASDTLTLKAGAGVTVTGSSSGGRSVTIAETYVDACVVDDLADVPSNLRNGGLIVLLSS